jgi:hypothetical protein
MPLTVFDVKSIPGHRRERIEAAVVAGGKHTTGGKVRLLAQKYLNEVDGFPKPAPSPALTMALPWFSVHNLARDRPAWIF